MQEKEQTFIRKYQGKEIIVTRKCKQKNNDTQLQIKISSELKEKVKEKLLTDPYYKDISKLVKDFLEKYVGKDD